MRRSLVALAALICCPAISLAETPRPAAFFGILLINTTLAPTSDAERTRMAELEDRLVAGLEASGRYQMIDTAPVANKMKLYANLSQCNGCDTDMAAELGADVAVSGELQKTSNLILAMTIYVRDAATGELVAGGSADMRGNTDESWFRTLDWILRNRIFKD